MLINSISNSFVLVTITVVIVMTTAIKYIIGR